MADPDEAERRLLRDWLAQYDRFTASTYGALDVPLGLVRQAKLNGIRTALDANLVRLNKILRSAKDANRQSLASEHIAALRAVKLLRDDLFLVELELLRTQRLKAADRTASRTAIQNTYDLFLKNWIAASPIIHPDTIDWFWPRIRDFLNAPFMRGMTFETRARPADLASPVELARSAIKRELPTISNDPKVIGLTEATLHLIGTACILAQVELAMHFANDACRQADVASWYSFTAAASDLIRELLGIFDVAIREAIRDDHAVLRAKLEGARRRMLQTLALYYSVPARECALLAAFAHEARVDVVGVNGVAEKLTLRPGLVRTDNSRSPRVMLGYISETAFPLVYPLREVLVPPGHPSPRWNRVAQPVLFRSYREALEQWHQIFFSVSETVTEQHELIADFMELEGVRGTFGSSLRKNATLDLIDRAVRGSVLASAMKTFGKQLSPDQALAAIISMIQRYLTYFTRHTGDNVRDSGPPYLSSKWPTDLSGRQFFDCGVYAVETAFDLMRAVRGVKGLTLEFRFLVFPEHVALVVYHDKTSFAVNNARIFLPRPLPSAATARARDDAGFSWATVAMQDAYSARFAIVPAMLQMRSLTSAQSEVGFKTALWASYQSMTGLVINNTQAYFKSARAFDFGSTLLAIYLIELAQAKLSKKERDEVMDRATEMTAKLYGLATVLADSCNFFDTKNAGFLSAIGIHVNGEDELVQAAQVGQLLPMHQFVERLKKEPRSRLSGAQQELIALPTGRSHADALTSAMGSKPCTLKYVQALGVAHVVLEGDVQQLLSKAPARVKDRITAATALPAGGSGDAE